MRSCPTTDAWSSRTRSTVARFVNIRSVTLLGFDRRQTLSRRPHPALRPGHPHRPRRSLDPAEYFRRPSPPAPRRHGSDSSLSHGPVSAWDYSSHSCLLPSVGQWNAHDVLGHKPSLQLVAPNDIAHDQIVGSIIAGVRRKARHRARFLEDDFMRVQQAGDLHGHFLAAFGWPRDQGHFGHVRRHGDAHAAQHLDPFGNRVDELILLAVMFVEEQMQLIERWPRELP